MCILGIVTATTPRPRSNNYSIIVWCYLSRCPFRPVHGGESPWNSRHVKCASTCSIQIYIRSCCRGSEIDLDKTYGLYGSWPQRERGHRSAIRTFRPLFPAHHCTSVFVHAENGLRSRLTHPGCSARYIGRPPKNFILFYGGDEYRLRIAASPSGPFAKNSSAGLF